MSKQLAKCPFCGGEAELQRCFVPSESVVSLSYTVSCKSCLCKKGSYPTKELATEKWNTRTPVEEVVARLEEEGKLADEERDRCARENPLHFDTAKGYATGIYNAIEIIKQEMM